MKDITKKYTNGEVTIVWKPNTCIHSTICWKGITGLGTVFNPSKKPWIDPLGANTDKIIEQVKKCPSGALSFYLNDKENESTEVVSSESIIEVTLNGPLMIYGNLTVKDHNGNETKKNKVTAFCRCGSSGNKPYCDGTHKKIDFKG